MKTTVIKFIKLGKKFRFLIAGGLGKQGPYAYAGVKHKKSGASIGASIGTRGKEAYGSVTKKKVQGRLKYNFDTGKVSPRIRLKKKRK